MYDGDGNLVKKVKPDGSKTLYINGIYEVDKRSGGTVTQTRTFYPAGGAMRVDGTRYYILKDQLGSASVVTNQSGSLKNHPTSFQRGLCQRANLQLSCPLILTFL